jgi:hypothetical protein
LYITPRKAPVNVAILMVQTDTPEVDLDYNIEQSITAFLDAYKIGEDLEFSDLIKYIYQDYETSRVFSGIDEIQSCTVNYDGVSISSFGQKIDIEEDQRIDPGTVTVTIVT